MKKTTAFIALLATSASIATGCGKTANTPNTNSTVSAAKPTESATKVEDPTQASTEKATEKETESSKPAGDVKVATLDDIKHKDFEYGITSTAGAAKKLKIVEVESNTDTYCIAIENTNDEDIKVSFLREDQSGYTVGIYAHQIRVINTNFPKSEPFPHHDIAKVTKMADNQKVLDQFTTTFKKGSGNDLVVEFEATKKGDKLMGYMTYNLVKDGVVYFPGVRCQIKSEGSVSLRYNKPSSTTYKNDNAFDFVTVFYSDFDKSVI